MVGREGKGEAVFVTYSQDGDATEDTKGHLQKPAAEHEQDGEFLPEGQVRLPDHGDGDGHEVKVGDGVHDHDEDVLQRRDGWFAVCCFASVFVSNCESKQSPFYSLS